MDVAFQQAIGRTVEEIGSSLIAALLQAKAPAAIEALSIAACASAHADVAGPLLDPMSARVTAAKLREAAARYEQLASSASKPRPH